MLLSLLQVYIWLRTIKPIIKENESVVLGNELPAEKTFISDYIQKNSQRNRMLYLEKDKKYIRYIDTKNLALKKELMLKFLFSRILDRSEDTQLCMNLLDRKIKIRYLDECCVKHSHITSALNLFAVTANRGYWAHKVSRVIKIPSGNYGRMSLREIFIFFPSICAEFLLSIGNLDEFKRVFFEFILGLSWRLGVISEEIEHLLHA